MRTCSSGITEATTTSAPARVSVSVMHEVSISSLSSATGTSTVRRLACACMPLPLESTDAVVVFLKVPTLHKTKTRLIPRFGAEGAYAIAQALAEDTLRRLGSSPLLDDARRVACFAPADGADRLERLAGRGQLQERRQTARRAAVGRHRVARRHVLRLARVRVGGVVEPDVDRVVVTDGAHGRVPAREGGRAGR